MVQVMAELDNLLCSVLSWEDWALAH